MPRELLLVTALAFLFAAGCLESNPQPAPGKPTADLSSADTGYEGPDKGADGTSREATDGAPDAVAQDVPEPQPECFEDLCPAGPAVAPDPSVKGPYPVGVTTFEIELLDNEGNPRTVRIEAWYPTLDEYRDGPFDAIDLYEDAPANIKETVGNYKDALPPIPTDAIRDVPLRTDNGPYPLILFSHGAFGVRFQSVFFTVPLASHGYVVVSPDHTGATIYNLLEPDGYNAEDLFISGLDRPLDLTALLEEMLVRNQDPADAFFNSIDPENIAVSGHSFGGYAAFRMAFEDPRIKAVLAHEPLTTIIDLLGYKFEDLPVPCMMMAASLDKTLDPPAEMYEPYQLMPPPKYYLELLAGGHFTFSDICVLDLVYVANDLGIDDAENALDDGCADYNIPVKIAHPIINQFGIGYFNYYLRNSGDSFQYFNADAAAVIAEHALYESVLE